MTGHITRFLVLLSVIATVLLGMLMYPWIGLFILGFFVGFALWEISK